MDSQSCLNNEYGFCITYFLKLVCSIFSSSFRSGLKLGILSSHCFGQNIACPALDCGYNFKTCLFSSHSSLSFKRARHFVDHIVLVFLTVAPILKGHLHL